MQGGAARGWVQGGYAHGQGASSPWLPEMRGHWGLLQSREGLNLGIFLLHLLRHKELLCVPTREIADGDVTDALVGRPSRHKSHRFCSCRAAAGMGLNRVAAASGLGLAYWVVHAKAQSARKGPEQKTLHQCGRQVTFLQT